MNPALQRLVVLPLIDRLRGEPIGRCLAELRRSEALSGDELRALQWHKLRRLLDHCYRHVPLYRERFDEAGVRPEEVRTADDLARLPTVDKDDLRFSFERMRATDRRRRVETCRSGGTLGKPVTLLRDMRASAYARAIELRAFEAFGIRRGDRQVRIWGVPFGARAAARERRKDRALNRIRISPFEITDATVREYAKRIERFGARYAYGYPSAVDAICRRLDALAIDGTRLGLRHVVCSAETLYPHQRERISATLGCRVVDEYGCSEMGPIAIECPAGRLHLSMENILAEFVDDGRGGTELLLTNLNAFAMPLVRYRIGDTATPSATPCECGRGSTTMEFGAGRVLGILHATDGTRVSGTVFCYIAFDIIKKYGGIRDFRVRQRERAAVEVTLVRDDRFDDRTLERFSARIRETLGSDVRIDWRFLDEIPPEPSGKRLFVHSDLDGAES